MRAILQKEEVIDKAAVTAPAEPIKIQKQKNKNSFLGKHPNDIFIGKKLYAFRKIENLSAIELGKILFGSNKHQMNISNYERAEVRLSCECLYRAAKAFNRKVSDFFNNSLDFKKEFKLLEAEFKLGKINEEEFNHLVNEKLKHYVI